MPFTNPYRLLSLVLLMLLLVSVCLYDPLNISIYMADVNIAGATTTYLTSIANSAAAIAAAITAATAAL